MLYPDDLRRFMQQPVLNVIGMLGATAATKIGYAGFAAETIMTCLLIYVSATLVAAMFRWKRTNSCKDRK